MDLGLKGKVALVAGGSQGLGLAVAMDFAREGAKVAICALDDPHLPEAAEAIRKTAGGQVFAIPADVSDLEQAKNFVRKAAAHFGTVDILVNNAAMNVMKPILDLREDGFDKVMNNNLKGYFLCTQAAARVMVSRKKGNIISLVSAGAVKAEPALGVYGIAKAGILMMTKVFAVDLAPHGVRVNAIGPGMVKTGFSQPIWGNPEIRKMLEDHIPLRRLAEPEEIASVALFLASDASSYVTGHTLFADGGALA